MNRLAHYAFFTGIVVALAACSSSHDESGKAGAAGAEAPALPVSVERLQAQTIANLYEFSGRARARQEAEIRPQVSGIIQKRFFDGGETVQANAPLFQIDAAEYRAAVNSAKAGVASARTAVDLARDQAERLRKLVESGAVSAQQYDTAKATYDQARAQLQGRESTLASAQISLDRSTVRSPIQGAIGRPTVTIGALVTQNQAAPLAIVTQLDPIYVDITVPAVSVLNYKTRVASGEITADKAGTTPVGIVLENGEQYPQKGLLNIVEQRVDETGGTVTLRATVPNPDKRILPGSFLRAIVEGGQLKNAITIPQAALVRTPRGDATVLLVNKDNVIEQRPITLGNSYHNRWVVSAGLSAGERIVLANFQRLHPGMKVAPQEQGDETAHPPTPPAAADAAKG